jgi:hypothetical protein
MTFTPAPRFYVKDKFAIAKNTNTWLIEARGLAALCPRRPGGRLSAISVLLCKSVLYGAFVWVRRALNSRKRRSPARAVVMWVMFKPLITRLAERRVIMLGLFVDFLFFAGFSFMVTDLQMVFAFTMVGMLGIVNCEC